MHEAIWGLQSRNSSETQHWHQDSRFLSSFCPTSLVSQASVLMLFATWLRNSCCILSHHIYILGRKKRKKQKGEALHPESECFSKTPLAAFCLHLSDQNSVPWPLLAAMESERCAFLVGSLKGVRFQWDTLSTPHKMTILLIKLKYILDRQQQGHRKS